MRWLVCLVILLAGCGVVKAPSGMGGLKGITTLDAAEMEYHSDNGLFAASLQELGANLIGRDLASGEKDGYRFTMTPTPVGYTISATPLQQSINSRSYFSDQRMRIHVHVGSGAATEDDPTSGGDVIEGDPVISDRPKTAV